MFGIAAFCIAACMLGLPGRVKKLERKIRQREREEKGGFIMSELLKQLEGTKCTIRLTSGGCVAGGMPGARSGYGLAEGAYH